MKKRCVEIRIKSIDKNLNAYFVFISKLLKKLKIKYSRVNLPKKMRKITLLKSPHVNKKAREQFEICTYKMLIKIYIKSQSINFLKFIILNKPKYIKLYLRRII